MNCFLRISNPLRGAIASSCLTLTVLLGLGGCSGSVDATIYADGGPTDSGPPTDAGLVHDCYGSPASGTPCDFSNSCSAFYDGYGNRWGSETWSCVDGFVVHTDNTYLGVDCTVAVTGTPSATMRLAHLGLAGSNGLNVDGINNAPPPAGMGTNIAGCGVVDSTGGVDDALSAIATTLTGVVDLPAALGNQLGTGASDAGLAGSLTIDVELFDLAANGYDQFVCSRLIVRAPGQPDVTLVGSGSASSHVVNLTYASDLPLSFVPELSPTACVNQQCNPSALALTLRSLRGRFLLDAAHTQLMPSSALSGYLFLGDCRDGTVDPTTGACVGGSYATLNPTGVRETFTSFANASSLEPTLATSVLDAFDGARDLHVQAGTYPTLAPCTGTSTSSVDSNAISVGIAIDSVLP